MYIGEHQANKHQCGVNRYSKKTQYTNCQGSHQANSALCSFWQRIEVPVCKNKAAKKVRLNVKAMPIYEPSKKNEKVVTTSE